MEEKENIQYNCFCLFCQQYLVLQYKFNHFNISVSLQTTSNKQKIYSKNYKLHLIYLSPATNFILYKSVPQQVISMDRIQRHPIPFQPIISHPSNSIHRILSIRVLQLHPFNMYSFPHSGDSNSKKAFVILIGKNI